MLEPDNANVIDIYGGCQCNMERNHHLVEIYFWKYRKITERGKLTR